MFDYVSAYICNTAIMFDYVSAHICITAIMFDYVSAYICITASMFDYVSAYICITAIMFDYVSAYICITAIQRGDRDFFRIVAGMFQGVTLAPYMLIICLDFVLQISIDLMKENGFTLEKASSIWHPAQNITETDYGDDIANK